MERNNNDNNRKNETKINPLWILAWIAYGACLLMGIFDLITCFTQVKTATLLVIVTITAVTIIVGTVIGFRSENMKQFIFLLGRVIMTGFVISGGVTIFKYIVCSDERTLISIGIAIALLVILLINIMLALINSSKQRAKYKRRRKNSGRR